MIISKSVLTALFMQCGASVSPITLQTIVEVESGGNPYVIANVTDGTSHKFETKELAIKFADDLAAKNKMYSVGLMQIYSGNFKGYDLTNKTAFNYCANISTGAKIIETCYERAKASNKFNSEQDILRGAASCYYSNNFTRGFKKENNGFSYVDLIEKKINSAYKVPAFKSIGTETNLSDADYIKYNLANDNKTADIENIEGGKGKDKRKGVIVQEMNSESKMAWDIYNDFK